MRPRVWKPRRRIWISESAMEIIVTGEKSESNLHPLKKKNAREPGGPSRSASPPTNSNNGG